MQLYSELYNCYYNIIHNLLSRRSPFSRAELETVVNKEGFSETTLYLIPKIASGEWSFFEKNSDLYVSTLENEPAFALSLLQKRWLKAILADDRIGLFLSEEQLTNLLEALKDVEPLYRQSDFHIYDRYSDGDNYNDPDYRNNFRTILSAICEGQYLNIEFESHKARRIHYRYLPCRLEYSIKNNRFRLLALESRGRSHYVFHTINLSRITNISETGKYADNIPDIDKYIINGYNEEPVTLLITNERNALERAMLQFANYKKNTTRIDENTYQCDIYYNKSNETELLIEVLSFGPAIRVVGNDHFLNLIRTRMEKQRMLILPIENT